MAFESDERLKEWVANVLPGVTTSLAAPDGKSTGRGVGLYLLELIQTPAPSTVKRPPLQLTLKYLVFAWSDDPEDAHRMLIDLMFAAMDNGEFQVETESMSVGGWANFGVAPQPSFLLRVPLKHERPQPQTKLVLEPLHVQVSPLVSFHGVLLGPGNMPLSNCRVELPSLNLASTTDEKGRFHFASVPALGTKRFLIKARGYELPISSERNYPDSGAPLVVHFSPLEG